MQVAIDTSWFASFLLLAIGIIIVFKQTPKNNKIKSCSSNDLDKLSNNTTITLAVNVSATKQSCSSDKIKNTGGL